MTAPDVPIGRALRILRIRVGISLTDAEAEGGPDAQTVGEWEADQQMPSLPQLIGYLTACHLSLHDLQDALDQIAQRPAHLHQRLAAIERRLSTLERR